jgi:hypothetical protein
VEKLVKIAVFALIGYAVSEAAGDVMESLGVPKQVATVAGGVIGAII